MPRKISPWLAALAIRMVCLAGCSRYDAGQAAFKRGDYTEALARWKRLAQFGDAKA